uniref:E3 ubiquitin-protein ligase TRIM7-like n=1 Tax=Euleptes europaea TaxID=460621 RepID=UPI00253F7EC9|nr:E3 ubiquitin-protein ligase TRIM7-like [Euleptes europaea]
MATGHPVQELCEEVTCPICLEHFQDPTIIAECGHNFCRACLTQSWGEAVAEAPCPVCKQTVQTKSLRPNRQLANVVEIAKKLSLQERNGGAAKKEEAKERICAKHREPLKLFCQTDGILICTVCDRSKQHKHHDVVPAEEASQEYKDKIFNCLETLRTEKEKIQVYLADAEDESQEMLKIMESERQKTVAEFRTLHQLLREQENRLLAQIGEVEKEIARKRDEHLAKLSEKLSSFESLIREMEEKHQKPMSELLQDVRSILQRCEKKENFGNPEAFPSELKWRLQGCCEIGPFLAGVIKQFKDIMVCELQMQKANVTLEPSGTNTKLILSEDRRSIKCRSEAQDLYSHMPGSERFTAGCHFWEVIVGSEEGWIVGVARESVKGRFTITPEEGIWAVGRSGDQFRAFTKGIYLPLALSGELKRIRVSLNYNGGEVAFFDADRAALLYRFSGVSFSGDTLCPFFAVCHKGYIRVCP